MLATALLQQLTDDIGLARQLLALAETELEALSRRDLPRLEEVLAQKQPLIVQLSQHGSERATLLRANRLDMDRQGLVNLTQGSDEQAQILSAADELGELLEGCRAVNERNGRLIRSNQAAIGSMLGILRGQADTPNLYDSRGSTARVSHQRPLSQA
ncbi:flagella synthesis protein FlgN [Stutzerimonas tarimensis]|uniref:Flagella synthesis protein FlgN n=1 Tax=Stutzerimonas tarimensis TaxID=1507735 RepID=A0ABV7T8W2_9GAMM